MKIKLNPKAKASLKRITEEHKKEKRLKLGKKDASFKKYVPVKDVKDQMSTHFGIKNNLKVVGIIQCRTGSKRLPGKALLPLAGKPMIERYIERVKQCQLIDDIVLATTKNMEDNELCNIAHSLGIETFRGSENDLVDRIYKCAMQFKADIIVRLCADNPLIEAEEIDRVISVLINENSKPAGYKNGMMVSNTHNNGYPDGLGAEVYMARDFKYGGYETDEHREHPHKIFYEKGKVITIPCPEHLKGYSKLKLDVNTQEEYDYICKIYDQFGHNDFHFLDYAGGLK